MDKPILLIGAIGSGKSTAAQAIKEFGYTVKSVSELLGESLPDERKRERADFMRALSDLALQRGNGYAGEVAVEYAMLNGKNVIFDGFRRPEEIICFKEYYPESLVIGIIAPYSVMVKRVLNRERDIDIGSCPEKDVLRDLGMLPGYSQNRGSQNVSGCLGMCDLKFLSYGSSKSDFSDLIKQKLKTLLMPRVDT